MKVNAFPSVPVPSDAASKPEHQDEGLMKVARQYEALFTQQLISAMRKTVNKDGGLIRESNAEKIYQSMLDSEYSQTMAETNQFGLAKMIYDHLLRMKSIR